ncbi:MAG: DUF5110 domain-containing protein [Clostridia bacterium]|nr:DUF5110 domain-containing protein [Clostridia bacterium]
MVEKCGNGVKIKTGDEVLLLTPLENNIIRLISTKRDEIEYAGSVTVLKKPESAEFNLLSEGAEHIIKTDFVKICVNADNGEITFVQNGKKIFKETGREMEEFDSYRNLFGEEAKVFESANGVRTENSTNTREFYKKLYKGRIYMEFAPEEGIFGLGSHEEGFGNLRGKYRELYEHNMKLNIPFFCSTKGYGIFYDAGCYMEFHDDEKAPYMYIDGAREFVRYIILGDNVDEILHNYQMLTGKASMLPLYAFGYIQSKERYKTQHELIRTVEEYRKRKVPLDVIVLDWQSWPSNGGWGQKSFDKERFPDAAAMMDKIHALDAKLMISIWANPSGGCPNQLELQKEGCTLGDGATYNAFDKKARELYWRQAKEGLFDKGIDAWWCDSSEPFDGDWFGAVKPESKERVLMNTGIGKKYMPCDHINEYSIYHAMGIYEGQRSSTDEKRVLNLTRSIFPGQSRYATVVWSGDVVASWDVLKRQVPEGANYAVSGEPYWSTDIGAFFVKTNENLWFYHGDYENGVSDDGYKELYTRWLQYSTFLPVMRSHGTDTPREIWNFGEEGDMFYDAIGKFIKLRYELVPYIYSMAYEVTLKNKPMMKPLALVFGEDKNCLDKPYQFMFGDIMVAPVFEAMYFGINSEKLDKKKEWDVYLPCGKWFDFWTNKEYEGGCAIAADAPIDKIPLFVRAGSIIPAVKGCMSTKDIKDKAYTVKIYAGKDASFTLYEDEGDNYNYEKGEFGSIQIQWCEKEKELTIFKRMGSFGGMSKEKVMEIEVIVSGKVYKKELIYKNETIKVKF